MSIVNCIDVTFCVRLVHTLSHFVWQGILIYLFLWLTLSLMRRSSSSARYTVSLMAFLSMAICPAVTFLLNGSNDPAVAPETTLQMPLALPSASMVIDTESVSVPSVAQTHVSRIDWKRYAPYVVIGYLAGVVGMLIRLLMALQGGRRICRRAQLVYDPPLLAALARQAKILGLSVTPALGYCRQIVVPTVVGVLRPMILLPISLSTGLSAEQIEILLAHELAHIRRYDHLVNILQRVLEAVLFFHPCIWLISRRIRIERENCCDDLVLAGGVEDVTYADSLLKMAEIVLTARARHPLATIASLGAAERLSPLRQRILRVIKHSTCKPVHFVSGSNIAILTFGLAITLAVLQLAVAAHFGQAGDQSLESVREEGSVYILGHVKQRGLYTLSEDQRLTLRELIFKAGGYTGNDINRASVTLTKKGIDGQRYIARKIGFITLLENAEYDIVLCDDDRIYVTSGPTPVAIPSMIQDTLRGTVCILGQLKQPAVYPLAEGQDMTLTELIDAAGGFSGDDMKYASITLSRYGADGKRHIARKIKFTTLIENADENVLLRSGDLVTLSSKPFYRPVLTVKLVVGKDQLTLEGQKATWDRLPAMLEKLPNRLYTVLCVAIAEDDIPTTEQLNTALAKASEIVDTYGFESYDFVGFKPLGDQSDTVQYVPIESMHYGSRQTMYIDDSLLKTHITDPPGRPQYAVRLVIGTDRMTFQGQDVTWQQLPEMLAGVSNREFTVFEIAIASDSPPPGHLFNEAGARADRLQQQFGFERLKEVRPQPLGAVGSMTRYFTHQDALELPSQSPYEGHQVHMASRR